MILIFQLIIGDIITMHDFHLLFYDHDLFRTGVTGTKRKKQTPVMVYILERRLGACSLSTGYK